MSELSLNQGRRLRRTAVVLGCGAMWELGRERILMQFIFAKLILVTSLAAVLPLPAHAETAANVTFDDSGTNLTGVNVQEAIEATDSFKGVFA
jgi:hypothetical protein